MKYQQALHSDLSAIKELLESSGLPANDIEAHLVNFIVAKESNKVIGVGGWETCNEFALLRSFSVNKNHKCLGVAERILTLVEEHIVSLGVRGFYLLTDTALNYFERFGFYVCSRKDAPESVRKTKQFSELCPDTATMMYNNLSA